jgi:glycosyltransferase involved in cell wall biosynthesis
MLIDQSEGVSVVLPTYNSASTLRKSIDSVLIQTHKNLELIIVDNFSNDNTEKIISTYRDDRIKYFKFNNNGIIACSRNFGVKKSKHDIIAFIDSDDIWIDEKLEKQLQIMNDKQIFFVSSEIIPIGESKRFYTPMQFNTKNYYSKYQFDDLVQYNMVTTSSVILTKKIFNENSGFSESEEFKFIEDWEFWIRISKNYCLLKMNEKLVYYNIEFKKNRNQLQIEINKLKILDLHQNFIRKKIYKKSLSNIQFAIGKEYLQKSVIKSLKYNLKSFYTFPISFKTFKIIIAILLAIFPKYIRVKLIDLFIYSRSFMQKNYWR